MGITHLRTIPISLLPNRSLIVVPSYSNQASTAGPCTRQWIRYLLHLTVSQMINNYITNCLLYYGHCDFSRLYHSTYICDLMLIIKSIELACTCLIDLPTKSISSVTYVISNLIRRLRSFNN